MADDSIEVPENFDFHPCNSPRGMLFYDLEYLTTSQRTNLNQFKRDTVRENEKYLARHPEVRALVSLLIRHVLKHRPRTNLPEFVGSFFARAKLDLQNEIEKYIQAREPHIYEGDSAVIVRDETSEEVSETNASAIIDEDLSTVPLHAIDEILSTAYDRLGIDVSDTNIQEDSDTLEQTELSLCDESVIESVISEVLKKLKSQEKKESKISSFADITQTTTLTTSEVTDKDSSVQNPADTLTEVTTIEISIPGTAEDVSIKGTIELLIKSPTNVSIQGTTDAPVQDTTNTPYADQETNVIVQQEEQKISQTTIQKVNQEVSQNQESPPNESEATNLDTNAQDPPKTVALEENEEVPQTETKEE